MKKLRIGLIGIGGIGKVHGICFMNNPEVEVLAACARTKENLEKFGKGEWGKMDYLPGAQEYQPPKTIPRLYTDYKDLVKDKDINAVVISTPNVWHAKQTIDCLKAGKHVLVEKPMAANAKECAVMMTAAKKVKRLLMAAHCWRFHKEVQFIKEKVKDGILGKIIKTKGYGIHVNWGPSGWFTQKKLAIGGALIDMGIHAIDTVRFLLGEPKVKSVYAKVGTCFGKYNVDDMAVLMVEFSNGTVSLIESGWHNPHSDGSEASTQLFGTNGYARVFPTEVRYKKNGDWISESPPAAQGDEVLKMYQAQADHFVDCALNNKKPVASAAAGMTACQIVDAAYASSRTGKVVKL